MWSRSHVARPKQSGDIGTHSSARASVGEAVRQAQIAALVDDLESWMRGVCNNMSRYADVATAIDHMLKLGLPSARIRLENLPPNNRLQSRR
jgi:hypothetical protein